MGALYQFSLGFLLASSTVGQRLSAPSGNSKHTSASAEKKTTSNPIFKKSSCNTTQFTSPGQALGINDINCGNWQAHKSFSYNLCFAVAPRPSTSGAPAMPHAADEACQSVFDSTLASFIEPSAKEIVGSMIYECTKKELGFTSINLRKVKPVSRRLRHLYRYLWQWGGQGSPMAYRESLELRKEGTSWNCAFWDSWSYNLVPRSCYYYNDDELGAYYYSCMKPNPNSTTDKPTSSEIKIPRASARPAKFPTKNCSDGSLVQVFLCCRWGDEEDDTGCSTNNIPFFQCGFGKPIHYSLVCDGNRDCVDNSDETVCQPPQLDPLLKASFICRNFQVIPARQRCDGRLDCFDESDEESCLFCAKGLIMCFGVGCVPEAYSFYLKTCPLKLDPLLLEKPIDRNVAIFNYLPEVIFDGYGMFQFRYRGWKCSEGFYPCQDSYCIPIFLFNNGEKDCLWGEDEGISVHNLTCPDYYRCRGSGSCIHNDYVCDGIVHCPYKDDEMFCHWSCPRGQGCSCEGQAYTCSRMIDPLQNLHVRYLDVSHASNVSLENVHFMEYLFFLNLSFCYLGNVSMTKMLHLETLDLSFNSLTGIASLKMHQLPKLQYLDMSNNPLIQTTSSTFNIELNGGTCHSLKILILTNLSLDTMEIKGFSALSKLRYLDVRENPLHNLDKNSLFGLTALDELYTNEPKLCCGYFHPSLPKCYAPVNELSSCSDLLAQDFFRVFLWVLSMLTVLGNTGVLVYRQFVKTCNVVSPSLILVKNLCAADLLMGGYMVMVGVADVVFSEVYVAKENEWKGSTACTVAGFLSFLSSEVSALVICLITMDRGLVMCFPFNFRIHFSPSATICTCCMVWVSGIVLAAVPLLVGLDFYGQSAICIPLPITRRQFSGQIYAFSVFIVLNFVLFVFIGLGQLFIYRAVRNASTAARTQQRDKDLTVARRLFQVAFTDFCCWFPIGLMGLLAARGTPIPERVNVWSAIFVLPLNSALNPFLYTLNGVMEQVRKQRMEKKMRKILGSLQTEIQTWQPANVQELMKTCLRSKLVPVDTVQNMLDRDQKKILN